MSESPTVCANCEAPLAGAFCSVCGQRALSVQVSFWALLGQWLREAFEADGRLGRTVLPLFFKPGYLAVEYLRGRRVHYTSPIRLYIFALLVAVMAVQWIASPELHFDVGSREEALEARRTLDQATGFWAPRIRALQAMGPDEASETISRELYDAIPPVVTLMLPLAALLLELFYRRRYYVEHLVLTIELHALGLLLFAIAAATRTPWAIPPALAITLVHFVGSLRAVYRQSWPRTIVKAVFLVALYGVLVIAGLVGALLLAVARS